MMVHTVDFFRSFVSDPFLFGQIAANHALSDVHAMGADPTTALAIATIPFGGEAQVEGTLEQLLAGALKTLKEAGCALVGGHTCEGADLALGLSVNGVARGGASSLLGKGGAAPGDALVLTKAVGTGAILAAEMRGRATSPWVQPAITSMLQSNGPAATVLRDHGARSCTDVTGFGVAGHLSEMLRAAAPTRHHAASGASRAAGANSSAPGTPSPGGGHEEGGEGEEGSGGTVGLPRSRSSPPPPPHPESSVNAEISLHLLPVLPGAIEVVDGGIVSTLQGQNEKDNAATVQMEGLDDGDERGARFRLLFDPQTAGGLLASVPRDRAETCVSALRQAGYVSAAVIGRVTEPKTNEEGGRISVLTATATRAPAPHSSTK
ncbi:unnamed protein product [Scytosiphon promiscuus]